MLSKPDGARSPFPLQQFLEMMSLFIKKIEKEKCVCASGSTRAKVRGEGGKPMKDEDIDRYKKGNRRVGSGQK